MRALALCLFCAACGDGMGMRGMHCSIDGDCEKGLSCQDHGANDECEPDGTIGCKSASDCASGEICFPFQTGAFCQPGAIVDASIDETID